MSRQWFIGDDTSDGDVPDRPSCDTDNKTMAFAHFLDTKEPSIESSILYDEPTLRHLRGSASMPSSSPVSLTFSSNEMSRVNSSSCLDTPDASHTDLFRDQPVGRTPQVINPKSEVKGWIGYDPGSTDKNWKSCYPCFVRNKACLPRGETTRCVRCKSSQSYCKGSIEAPIFVNVDALRDAASSALLKMHTLPDHPISELLSLNERDSDSWSASHRSLPIPVSLPLTKFPYLDGLPLASEMLDDILALGNVYPRAIKAGVALAKFEVLCRRFCACMILLRGLKMCRIDPHIESYHNSYRLALGFVMRLSILANDLLIQIFEQVKICCEAKRHKTGTKKTMSTLASSLGQIVTEMRHLRLFVQSFPNIPLLPILEQIPKAERTITFYGKSFDNDIFGAGSQSDSYSLPGIHLQIPHPTPATPESLENVKLNEWPSAFDILNFEFTSSSLLNDLHLNPNMQKAIFTDNSCDNTVAFDPTHACQETFRSVCRGRIKSQATGKLVDLSRPAAETIAQIESEKAQIQIKINDLQKLMTDKEVEIEYLKRTPSLRSNHSEQTSHEQYDLSESPGKEYSQEATPVQLEGNLQRDMKSFLMHDFNEILPMAEENFSLFHLPENDENVDMVDSSTVDESKRDRKRKRFSPPAPSKKKKDDTLSENGMIAAVDLPDESTTMADAQISDSKPRIRDSTTAQLKQHVTEVLCNNSQPRDNEQGSTLEDHESSDGNDTDTKVSPYYEHRPKTWPFRQAFRRSVDFSVKSLVKGLEKLKV